jgi:predicted Zn-dependent protease
MNNYRKATAAVTLSLFLLHLIFLPAALGITIQEEEELSKELLQVINKKLHLIKDPLVVGYVNNIGKSILAKMPQQPFTYQFYVVKQHVPNAFATPAGHIFINSGLLATLETEEELAGILAHEIAHVVSRHISQNIDRSPKIGLATLAGIAAGIFIGAGGAAALGNAVVAGSMAAGQSVTLTFSREDEIQADQLALEYLYQAGYGGQGLLLSMQKIRSKQWIGTEQIPDYLMTHPASEERIAYIDTYISGNPLPESDHKKIDPDEFRFVQATILGKHGDGSIALANFDARLKADPQDTISLYGKALALAQLEDYSDAVHYLKKALERDAFNATFLKEMGRIYFLQGHYPKALQTLAGSYRLAPQDTESLYYLARTNMALGNLTQAVEEFNAYIGKNPKAADAHRLLGSAYGMQDLLGMAHYHLGKYNQMIGRWKTARIHLQKARPLVSDPKQIEEIETMLKQVKKAANREAREKENK